MQPVSRRRDRLQPFRSRRRHGLFATASRGRHMKKLECIIRPHKLEEVREVLDKIDVHGMTVSEVRGFGRQKGHAEHYRGVEYKAEYQPKLKLEILVREDQVTDATKAIMEAAKTGKFGDGKIFVSQVDEVLRIRTGDRGEQAL